MTKTEKLQRMVEVTPILNEYAPKVTYTRGQGYHVRRNDGLNTLWFVTFEVGQAYLSAWIGSGRQPSLANIRQGVKHAAAAVAVESGVVATVVSMPKREAATAATAATAPEPVAFTTAKIVTTVQGSLWSRAVAEIYTSVGDARVWIKHPADIRFFQGRVQVLLFVWEDVTVRGIGELAQQEHLNWLRPDGTIWLHDQDILTLPGATAPEPVALAASAPDDDGDDLPYFDEYDEDGDGDNDYYVPYYDDGDGEW